jgi:ferredoxin-type protein NapH
MDCFDVCPEPQVIRPALFGKKDGIGTLINEPNCTNCGRCIDVCSKEVFVLGSRFDQQRLTDKNLSDPNQAGITQAINLNSDNFEQEEAIT